jgi:hypothetical protein
MTSLEDEITALLRLCETLWDKQDYAGLRALWDEGEAEPWYVAEEIDTPMVGWEAMQTYWNNNIKFQECIRVRYSNIRIKPLGPDLALALFDLRFDLQAVGPRKPMGGDNRVTAIFRRRPDGWRYCHYMEAPLSPITYIRKLYELNIAPEFPAFLESHRAAKSTI